MSRASLVAMTYNVRNAHPDPGHEWAVRAGMVAEIVRRNAVDVWGAQEVLPAQRTDLARLLPEYDVFGVGRDGAGVDEAVPVLWRRDRFERVDAGVFWLSGTPDAPGSNTWGGLCPRVATWVRLRDRAAGAAFVFCATHLDHDPSAHGDRIRVLSVRLLATRLPGDAPVILAADLNAMPGSAAHRELSDGGFVPATPGTPQGPSMTTAGIGILRASTRSSRAAPRSSPNASVPPTPPSGRATTFRSSRPSSSPVCAASDRRPPPLLEPATHKRDGKADRTRHATRRTSACGIGSRKMRAL